MKKIKPINILDTRWLRTERAAVMDGIIEMLLIGKPTPRPPVTDYGNWRHPKWLDEDNKMQPYLSVDWYVMNAYDKFRKQVDAKKFLMSIKDEPWRRKELLDDHYDIMLIDHDLFSGDEESGDKEDYIIGFAQPFIGAVISTHRLERLDVVTYSVLKTETIHQLGHVFGIPNKERGDLDQSDGTHCTNKCSMRNVSKAPEEWIGLTEERLRSGPLCKSCAQDLWDYFHS